MKHEVLRMIDTSIVTALITAGVTLIGTTITVAGGNKKISNELDKHNAIQDERISELTRRVELHNQVVERTYRLESDARVTAEKLENIERRLDAAERQ